MSGAGRPWVRPTAARTGPIRRMGGVYRTAQTGEAVGGVPLASTEDAMVAAVRMAYRVADAQVERSARLAQRLRTAGDAAAGPNSDRKAVDAAEQLVFRAMMAALAWLEGAVAEPDHPLRRLMGTEYRMLQAMLGRGRKAARDAAAAAPPAPPAQADGAAAGRVRVVLQGDVRRPVRIRDIALAADPPLGPHDLQLYCVKQIAEAPMRATLRITAEGATELAITVGRLSPAGRWTAAICDAAGVQLGAVEIEL